MKLASSSLIIFVSLSDFSILITSPLNTSIGWPSYNTNDVVLSLISVILISTVESSDNTMLLLITVWGAIGVNVKIFAVGSTIGPPQDRLYAVDPVGVQTNIPSAV